MKQLHERISEAREYVESRGTTPQPRAYDLALTVVELDRLATKYLQGSGLALYCAERDGTLDPAHVRVGAA